MADHDNIPHVNKVHLIIKENFILWNISRNHIHKILWNFKSNVILQVIVPAYGGVAVSEDHRFYLLENQTSCNVRCCGKVQCMRGKHGHTCWMYRQDPMTLIKLWYLCSVSLSCSRIMIIFTHCWLDKRAYDLIIPLILNWCH